MIEDYPISRRRAVGAIGFGLSIPEIGNLAGRQEGAGGEGALRHLLRKAALESHDTADGPIELQSSPRRN